MQSLVRIEMRGLENGGFLYLFWWVLVRVTQGFVQLRTRHRRFRDYSRLRVPSIMATLWLRDCPFGGPERLESAIMRRHISKGGAGTALPNSECVVREKMPPGVSPGTCVLETRNIN
ncbi:hypothetical protein CBOM_08039 [Ceraceosorus bombacis]|uniref:Uncharacterized protein n=1 Tax=Ceraceosorus bombacis TaxID=401625 RepID=A0A0N7L942_9BASI|nr:hypothetical protein CBOM_08039 [Ceraceosorus bombacis]